MIFRDHVYLPIHRVGYPDPSAFCRNVGYVSAEEIGFIFCKHEVRSMKQISFAKTCPTLLQKARVRVSPLVYMHWKLYTSWVSVAPLRILSWHNSEPFELGIFTFVTSKARWDQDEWLNFYTLAVLYALIPMKVLAPKPPYLSGSMTTLRLPQKSLQNSHSISFESSVL